MDERVELIVNHAIGGLVHFNALLESVEALVVGRDSGQSRHAVRSTGRVSSHGRCQRGEGSLLLLSGIELTLLILKLFVELSLLLLKLLLQVEIVLLHLKVLLELEVVDIVDCLWTH